MFLNKNKIKNFLLNFPSTKRVFLNESVESSIHLFVHLFFHSSISLLVLQTQGLVLMDVFSLVGGLVRRQAATGNERKTGTRKGQRLCKYSGKPPCLDSEEPGHVLEEVVSNGRCD